MYVLLGNQYWFGLRRPPCQVLFGLCPCLQIFGNVSYSLYNNNNNNNSSNNNSDPANDAAIEIYINSSKGSHDKLTLRKWEKNVECLNSQMCFLKFPQSYINKKDHRIVVERGLQTHHKPPPPLHVTPPTYISYFIRSLIKTFFSEKKKKKVDETVAPAITLELPD